MLEQSIDAIHAFDVLDHVDIVSAVAATQIPRTAYLLLLERIMGRC